MRINELLKILEESDCELFRHGTRHDIWVNPKTGMKFAVPRHGTKEVPIGTLREILKKAGVK